MPALAYHEKEGLFSIATNEARPRFPSRQCHMLMEQIEGSRFICGENGYRSLEQLDLMRMLFGG